MLFESAHRIIIGPTLEGKTCGLRLEVVPRDVEMVFSALLHDAPL